MVDKIKVAFLGVRHPHMWHRVAVIEQMSDVIDAIGFYDEDEYFANGFHSRTGLTKWDSLDTLLHQKPDICIIESRDTQTPDISRRAAPWTRAMILEKCSAPDYKTLKALASDLARYPVHIEHGYELHYLDVMDKCREIINSNALGQITLARFHGGSPSGCSDEIWVSDPDLMGGMFYVEGSHMIEIMLDTLGIPEKVCGTAKKLVKGDNVISNLKTTDLFAGAGNPPANVCVGNLAFEDVAVAVAQYADKIACIDCTAWEPTNWCNGWRMEYYGTNGTLTACPSPSWIDLFIRNSKAGYEAGSLHIEFPALTETYHETQMRNGYRKQLNKVIGYLQKNDPPHQDGMDTIVQVAKVAAQVYGCAD